MSDCGCHEVDSDLPVLDARPIPHAVRHGAIFGALDMIGPGGGMILVAPHDPLPLLAQAQKRYGDEFEVSYVERGPEAWKLKFARAARDGALPLHS